MVIKICGRRLYLTWSGLAFTEGAKVVRRERNAWSCFAAFCLAWLSSAAIAVSGGLVTGCACVGVLGDGSATLGCTGGRGGELEFSGPLGGFSRRIRPRLSIDDSPTVCAQNGSALPPELPNELERARLRCLGGVNAGGLFEFELERLLVIVDRTGVFTLSARVRESVQKCWQTRALFSCFGSSSHVVAGS